MVLKMGLRLQMVGLALFGMAWALPVHALDLQGLNADEVAVYVQNMDTGRMVAEHRADAPMNPASTMKLLTAWHGLQRLGADYRIPTYWHSTAKIDNGVLQGDLVWRGSGDPTFDHLALQEMLTQLRQQGVTQIQGKLVLDKSLWQSIPSANEFEHDSDSAFTVEPDTHMLDYHVVWLEMLNDGMAKWTMTPDLSGVVIDDTQLKWLTASRCGAKRSTIQVKWLSQVIYLTGSVNSACDKQRFYTKNPSSDDYVYRAFKAAWTAMGGSGADAYVSTKTPTLTGRILAKHQSQPLSQIIADMNKFSNNVIARSLVMLADNGSSIHADEALQNLKQDLHQAGMSDGSLVLENGSGLSRNERVSAKLMGQMLNQVYHSPNKNVFWNSLPIAGVDGTLKRRFKPLTGRLFMKTGTLVNVHGLAGYGVTEDGQTLGIVVLVNGKDTGQTLTNMDALVTQIMQLPH